MYDSIQIGYAGGFQSLVSEYDLFVVSPFLTENRCYSLAKKYNKPSRISGLFGSLDVSPRNIHRFSESYEDHLEKILLAPVDQIEVVNEFISRGRTQNLFSNDQVKGFVDIAKRHGKYTIVSGFKPWNLSIWDKMCEVLKATKPDGVGIQLHLKILANAEVSLQMLDTIIPKLQGCGVEVHFSEVSVWLHTKTPSFLDHPERTWEQIFRLAYKYKVKSLTPWFFSPCFNLCPPTFKNWKCSLPTQM